MEKTHMEQTTKIEEEGQSEENENTGKQDKEEVHPLLENNIKKTRLRLFLISDIHEKHKMLEKLKKWYFNINCEKFDFLLISGDFCNMPNKDKKIHVKECQDAETTITNMLSYLEFFSIPILYIPGNHDPYSLYIPDPNYGMSQNGHKSLTQFSTNLHLEAYELAEDLQIIGMGGAMPGYHMKGPDKGKKAFDGFPYFSEDEIRKDFQTLFNKYLNKEKTKQYKQTLLMVHGPPNCSGTNEIYWQEPEPYEEKEKGDKHWQAGSHAFSEFLMGEIAQKNLLGVVHGHTHLPGLQCVGAKVPVLNPGSIGMGDFAQLEIVKNQTTGKWIFASYKFLNLNVF